jgi:hypothetical protein
VDKLLGLKRKRTLSRVREGRQSDPTMKTTVTNSRLGFVRALQYSMPRDEFFAGLYILGCVNGIGLRVIKSVHELGWAEAFFATFQVSGIVLMACVAGISLLLLDKSDEIRVADLVFGAGFLVVIAVPINPAIWMVITALSFYILLLTNPQSARRRGAIIFLATAVPMFWSPYLFKFFANFILELDASLVAWMLHSARVGNMVRFADDSGYLVLFPACSSLANVSLAFLCWVTMSQFLRHRWSRQDLVWCFLACAAVVAVNVTRISIMGLSPANYERLHSGVGEMVVNLVILVATIGLCSLGVRRELFARA